VRQALFQSADKSRPNSDFYYGTGLLKARDALDIIPAPGALIKAQKADVIFPFLTLLFEYIKDPFPAPKQQMLGTEIAQLHLLEDMQKIIFDPHQEANMFSPDTLKQYVATLLQSKRLSGELRGFLTMVYNKM